MNVLVYLLVALVAYLIAFHFYGRFIARSLGETAGRKTPAVKINDGKDFVPTRPSVLFAHHYATIAGAGPIVGPVLGILYGIGPAWLWVVFGAIFFGAVHDFSALFASIREDGNSVAEIAKKSLGPTGFLLFITFTIILIVLVAAAFLSLTAISLTSLYPLEKLGLQDGQTLLRTIVKGGQTYGVIGGIASSSVIVITALAPLLGFLVTKRRISTPLAFVLAAGICTFSIWIAFDHPLTLAPLAWMIVISIYTFFSCEAPVWLILQPRDFVNVQILYAGMAAMIVGVVIGGFQGLTVTAPLSNIAVGTSKMGPVWPFLFIIIACGAISGFHSLVSSGTSSKQLAKESQAVTVGFGGMLLESLLAVLVLVIVGSSLNFGEYMAIVWPEGARGNPILAFALSMGHLMNSTMGISTAFGSVMGILIIEGFLITTLDSAVRLNRYLFEELWKTLLPKTPRFMKSFWFNSGLAVILMFSIAYSGGYKAIWPVFGATNQLLAAMTLIVVTVWLHRSGKKYWFTMIPAILMVSTTIFALVYKLFSEYIPDSKYILVATDILLLVLALRVVLLSITKFNRPVESLS
ncbi:MAG: carbon starvation CstA family protein [bacterium]|nr:carbon starvation CstA family protein [bacterium]